MYSTPVPEADILTRISAEGIIRNQIRRIGVYPFPITAQKSYPDNPWSPSMASFSCALISRKGITKLAQRRAADRIQLGRVIHHAAS